MQRRPTTFRTAQDLIALQRPAHPGYCIHPEVYLANIRAFVAGFPGRVLYVVEANDHPEVVQLIGEAGVKHFWYEGDA